jgi:hypothetical protein
MAIQQQTRIEAHDRTSPVNDGSTSPFATDSAATYTPTGVQMINRMETSYQPSGTLRADGLLHDMRPSDAVFVRQNPQGDTQPAIPGDPKETADPYGLRSETTKNPEAMKADQARITQLLDQIKQGQANPATTNELRQALTAMGTDAGLNPTDWSNTVNHMDAQTLFDTALAAATVASMAQGPGALASADRIADMLSRVMNGAGNGVGMERAGDIMAVLQNALAIATSNSMAKVSDQPEAWKTA